VGEIALTFASTGGASLSGLPRLVALVQCGKRKGSGPTSAGELYTGALFRKSVAYARMRGAESIYILSAKHGLLPFSTVIEPYEVTLNHMPKHDRETWRDRVVQQLREVVDLERDQILMLASARYREGIVDHIKNVEVPMAGLSQGRQLKFLTQSLP
jgi:hypothetical protein